jgi:hypothetical protein
VRSRKDAEKVMRIASSDNPEAAAEDERAKGRARDNARNGARSRSNKKQLDTDPVDHLLHLVDQLDAEQRQRFLAEIRRRYDD